MMTFGKNWSPFSLHFRVLVSKMKITIMKNEWNVFFVEASFHVFPSFLKKYLIRLLYLHFILISSFFLVSSYFIFLGWDLHNEKVVEKKQSESSSLKKSAKNNDNNSSFTVFKALDSTGQPSKLIHCHISKKRPASEKVKGDMEVEKKRKKVIVESSDDSSWTLIRKKNYCV